MHILMRDRRGKDRDKEEGLMKIKAILELFGCKPRNIWSHQKLDEARTNPFIETSEETEA